MPFISIETNAHDPSGFEVKSIALNVFDIENMKILQSHCCSPPNRDAPSLEKRSFSLCRISDPETRQVINKRDLRFTKGAIK